MKILNLICLSIGLIFLFSFQAFAQKDKKKEDITKIININFMNLPKDTVIRIQHSEAFAVRLINLNRFLFKVDGIKSETDFNITVPAALTGIKLPQYLSLPGTQIKDNSPTSDTTVVTTDRLMSRTEAALKLIKDNGKKMDDAITLLRELGNISKDCALGEAGAKQTAMAKTNFLISGKINFENQDAAALGNKLDDMLSKLLPDAEKALSRLEQLLIIYPDTSSKELKAYIENLCVSLKLNLEVDKKKLSQADHAKLKRQINSARSELAGVDSLRKEIKKTSSLLEKNVEMAREIVGTMKKIVRENQLFQLSRIFSLLTSPQTYSYTSEAMTATTDQIKFTLTVEPLELMTCAPGGKRVVEVTLKVKGGFKIDFSTGAFVNGGSNKFLGNSYYYHNIDADHREIVTADRNSRQLLSVGALMHFYWRSYDPVKFAVSVGVSTTANISDLNFHLGPSLIIGNKNRIVVSAGLTLKSSPVIDRNLQTNKSYTKFESPDEIPTLTQFPIGGYFVGITYNISKFSAK